MSPIQPLCPPNHQRSCPPTACAQPSKPPRTHARTHVRTHVRTHAHAHARTPPHLDGRGEPQVGHELVVVGLGVPLDQTAAVVLGRESAPPPPAGRGKERKAGAWTPLTLAPSAP